MNAPFWRPGEAWPVTRLSGPEWAAYYAAGFRWQERGGLRVLLDGPGTLRLQSLPRHLAADPPAGRFSWHLYDTLPSTMPGAHDLFLSEGVPHAVVADSQTAGRGRGKRTWYASPAGGLNLSLAWEGSDTMLSGVLTLALGVGVAKAIRRMTGQEIGLKWPNDGLIDGQKCFGILVEAAPHPRPHFVAGIGVNVNGVPPSEAGGGAVSLETATGAPWSRLVLAVRIAAEIALVLDEWRRDGPKPFLEAWRQLSVTLGHAVVVVDGSTHLEGKALDIADDGSLRVALASGVQTQVYAQDVSLRMLPSPGGSAGTPFPVP